MKDYQERMTEKYGDAEASYHKCKPRYLRKEHLQIDENNTIRLKENIAINYWDMTDPVIKEVEVEVIKEIEKPVEVVKEVIKEVEIIKEVENKDKQNKLQDSIKQLREDIRKKDDIILQLEKNVVELQKVKGPTKGQFMRSSNLNDNLYR